MLLIDLKASKEQFLGYWSSACIIQSWSILDGLLWQLVIKWQLVNRNTISEHASMLPHKTIVRSHFLMKILILRHLSFWASIFRKLKELSYLWALPKSALWSKVACGPTAIVHRLLLRISQHSVFRIYGSTIFGIEIFLYRHFFQILKGFWIIKSLWFYFFFFPHKREHEGEKRVCIFKLI